MTRLFQAAVEVQRWLEERNWKFCFIGGLAVQAWGQPRTTTDIDLTLMTGFVWNPMSAGVVSQHEALVP